ncbi:hypothetical protein ATANTOWER_003938 [Ataeniobius toweri]|uniref:Uncharacterized protein n=1 Tax=Ataeniobius toweri TaxID=208326 RepID=A0ABU7AD62_9TELE|nr:hypothetical protein [Ataeniobius toweri]
MLKLSLHLLCFISQQKNFPGCMQQGKKKVLSQLDPQFGNERHFALILKQYAWRTNILERDFGSQWFRCNSNWTLRGISSTAISLPGLAKTLFDSNSINSKCC